MTTADASIIEFRKIPEKQIVHTTSNTFPINKRDSIHISTGNRYTAFILSIRLCLNRKTVTSKRRKTNVYKSTLKIQPPRASLLVASWSRSTSTPSGGSWTYLTTDPLMKQFLTESCTQPEDTHMNNYCITQEVSALKSSKRTQV